MKLVMENKSGYIRPFRRSAHPVPTHTQPWDVSWPIENQPYLPNKEAPAMNGNEWLTVSFRWRESAALGDDMTRGRAV